MAEWVGADKERWVLLLTAGVGVFAMWLLRALLMGLKWGQS